jgi:hypothetical protein
MPQPSVSPPTAIWCDEDHGRLAKYVRKLISLVKASRLGFENGRPAMTKKSKRTLIAVRLTTIMTLALVSMSLCLPAQAQNVEVRSAVFCDTQQEVERFVAYFKGDAMTAINSVNAEMDDPSACFAATVVLLPGPEIASVGNWRETFHISRVMVIAVLTDTGAQAVTPTPTFAIERVEERVA